MHALKRYKRTDRGLPKPLPPADYLHSLMTYDPLSGNVTWKTRPRECFTSAKGYRIHLARFAGKPVGCAKGRYIFVHIDGKYFRLHRIIWKMQTGTDPLKDIDHRDLNKKNNVWTNLRQATACGTQHNQSMRRHNKSGFKGVSWSKVGKKWIAQICVNNIYHFLGYFAIPEDAAEAYQNAAIQLHGSFARTTNRKKPIPCTL